MTVSMSAVWDRTSEFLSDNLAAVAGIAALTIWIPTALWLSLQPLGKTVAAGGQLALALLWVAVSLVMLWGQLFVTRLAVSTDTPAESCAAANQTLPPMIWVRIMLLLLVSIFAAPALAMLWSSGIDFQRLGQPGFADSLGLGVSGIVIIYGLIAAAILLWLTARGWVLAMAVVSAEKLGTSAPRRAFALSRGLTWQVIGVLLLYEILSNVAVLAAKLVFGSIFALVIGSEGIITGATVATAVVEGFVVTIFLVAAAAYWAKLYLAARAREGAAAA